MSDEEKVGGSQAARDADAWEEVGRQFRSLGESLAATFRAAMQDETNQRRLREVQASMAAMANQVDRAIHEAADSPEGQRARDEAAKAAESLRTVGQQTAQEVAPFLVSALRQVNAELKRALDPEAAGKPASVEAKPADLPKVNDPAPS